MRILKHYPNGKLYKIIYRFTALSKTWKIILACFFIAFGVAGVYMLIVRYTAGLMVWLAILIYIVLVFVLGAYCLERSKEYEVQGDEDNKNTMYVTGWVIIA